jgi:hypothetical protein
MSGTGLTRVFALLGLVTLSAPPAAARDTAPRDVSLAEGARAVVAAVVKAARHNARLPRPTDPGTRPPYRLGGDELTVHYVRAAAAAARRLPPRRAAGAFLVGLGLGLDDSEILRGNPLTAGLCRQVESDAERKARLGVLGLPTMQGRRDWAQHFVVSCALTEVVGPDLAEAAGLLKEQLDMRPGGSGFSFADLSADLAGVAFANRVRRGEVSLDTLATRFVLPDYLPGAGRLREGLSAEQFAREYGTVDDPRFRAELKALRQRVQALPGHKRSEKKVGAPGAR